MGIVIEHSKKLVRNPDCWSSDNLKKISVLTSVIPNLPNSEEGRLRIDGDTVPKQTQISSKQQVSNLFWRRRGSQLKNAKTSLVLRNKE